MAENIFSEVSSPIPGETQVIGCTLPFPQTQNPSTPEIPELAYSYLEGSLEGHNQRFYLEPEKEFYLGRSPKNDIYINDNYISTRHFRIFCIHTEGSEYSPAILVDSSVNGTTVNSRPVTKGAPVFLQNADIIHVKPSYQFVFRYLKGDPGTKLRTEKSFFISNTILGTGAFATVRFAVCCSKRIQCAAKVIRKDSFNLSQRIDSSTFHSEIKIMKKLAHPNIVQILDISDSSKFLFIFLPYIAGGDLHGYITSQPELRVSEPQSCFIIFQVFLAIEYLHNLQIAHRDIKPENVLLMTKGTYPRVLVTDFGMARVMGNATMHSMCGTFQYIAPEVIRAAKLIQDEKPEDRKHSMGYGSKVDCWSAGVLLYALLAGTLPFQASAEDPEMQSLFAAICYDSVVFDDFFWDDISPNAKSMILKLIERDQKVRSSSIEALTHPWFKMYQKTIRENYAAVEPTIETEPFEKWVSHDRLRLRERQKERVVTPAEANQ